jgi:cell division protein FtsI (penicillin-binding protein 3)/stage V sporulation protein D (sporulation-specific penicillin-binding protein)
MRNLRKNLILIFLFLFGATIIGRLIYIQIFNYKLYKALAQGQQNLLVEVQGKRGEIFLENGNGLLPLAINKTWQFCYLSPKEIKDKEEAAKKISDILNLKKDEILAKIENEETLFVKIKSKLTDEEIENLKKSNLVGIYLGEETLRYYPQDMFLSQVIGFLGGEGKGQYGLEGFYDEILRTDSEFLEGKRSFGGNLILSNSKNLLEDQKEKDLILTIDYNIQFKAEKLLSEQKEKLEFERGQIIVADPKTGKILAMANFPNFDPNSYSEETDMKIFQNPTIQEIFEPGSVFKPIVMAAALNEEKITPQTIYQDPGIIKIGGSTIDNYGKKKYPGDITMTEVLEKSINTGAVFAERQVGHDAFLKYIEKFGFFEKTGIDLQEEIFSQNEELKKGYEINFATASFGQGIAITPIQLVRAFSAIANGGKLVKPYLVENLAPKENSENFIISRKTSSQLVTMMVSVVEKGFATRAKVPGYYIAGKTGTAQIPWSSLDIEKRGYSDKTIQTFVGFAPAFDPKFLILIKLDNPNTKTAEYSAVPIFGELAKYIINLWQIPPDYE